MTTVRAVYDFLDAWAPFSTAMSFDNAGLLAGNGKEEVRRAVLALDITPDVVREAAGCGAQLIISHHPVIFDPLRRLLPGSAPWLLAQNGLAAICAHTNLDLAPDGVNTCLAQRLGLSDIRTLGTDASSGLPESLCGDLSAPMEPRAFALHVKKVLGCESVEYTEGSKAVHTVGLCSGAGGSYFPADPAAAGIQGFVTGEAHHHELLAAREAGLTLVVAGHHHTEAVVLDPLREKLSAAFPDVVFSVAVSSAAPSRFV